MRYCTTCEVSVKGDWDVCPLCHEPLEKDSEKKLLSSSFLEAPLRYNRDKAKRTFIGLSLVLVLFYFIIQFFYPFQFFGLEYVLFGLFIIWTMSVIFMRKRKNIAKTIVYWLLFISLVSVYFDYTNGWLGWSITFVIPIISISALLSIFIAMQVIDLKVRDYILYLQLVALFGIIPLVFLILDWVGHPLPSLLSVILSLIMLVGVFINYRTFLIREIQKRMHI